MLIYLDNLGRKCTDYFLIYDYADFVGDYTDYLQLIRDICLIFIFMITPIFG